MTSPELDLQLGETTHHAALRMPTIGQTHVFVANPSLHRSPEDQALADSLQILDTIDTLDGEPPSMELAREITSDPVARNAVMQARAQWLSAWRECGVAYVSCPHCQIGEREFTLGTLASALGTPREELVDAQGRLLPFRLSFLPPPSSANAVPGRRLRFRLPSGATVGHVADKTATEGVLRPIEPETEARAWQHFAPIGVDPPEERDDWTFESAGFRALLRVACALESLGSKRQPEITPDDIESWPLVDFCFLTELYALVFLTTAVDGYSVPCPNCGLSMLKSR